MGKIIFNKPIFDMPSEEYHSIEGVFSSTQLKDILKEDEEFFYKKHILKSIPRESSSAFDQGSAFHTRILEPHLFEKEFAIYPKKMKYGKTWDVFKAKNKKKICITLSDKEKVDELVKSFKKSQIAVRSIKKGKPEVTLFVKLRVSGGKIYHEKSGHVLDPKFGWIASPHVPEGQDLRIKVRADFLSDCGFIFDLKSTSGAAKSNSEMMSKVSNFNYDLSASLYVDIFQILHLLGKRDKILGFKWIFVSKDKGDCRVHRASDTNILVGRGKWIEAAKRIARNINNGWSFPDREDVLEPMPYELVWIMPSLDEQVSDTLLMEEL